MTAYGGGRRELLDMYNRSDYLDAKWGVMRRFRVSERAFEDWVVELLDLAPSAVVLDVGAGAGRFTLPLARRLIGGGRVEAVDISENVMTTLVATAAEERLPVEPIVADVEECRVAEGRYDAIVAGHMLYYLRRPVETLYRLKQALKPDGEVVATTNARSGMPELYAMYQQTLDVLGLPVPAAHPESTEFTSELGAELLGKVFSRVRPEQYDGGFVAPNGVAVLTYFTSTELYRAPMHDEDIPLEIRARIAPTYAALAQGAVDAAGGRLLISKPMTAFFCKP